MYDISSLRVNHYATPGPQLIMYSSNSTPLSCLFKTNLLCQG